MSGFKIYHNTNCKLSLLNRLRVLWNGEIKTRSTIVVDKDVAIIDSSSGVITTEIIRKKHELGGIMVARNADEVNGKQLNG